MKYTDEEIDFLNKNYKLKGRNFCARKLNRSGLSVTAKANKLGIKRQNNYEPIDTEQFINIKKPEVAYLLGFLWADGYVSKRSVTCLVATDDFLDLKKTLDEIGSWYLHGVEPEGVRKHRTVFGRYDEAFTKIFLDYGFKDKSKLVSENVINSIPEEIRHYFWRGFFDGDGNINKLGHYRASIAGPIDFDWTELKNQLNKLEINYSIIKIKRQVRDVPHSSSRLQVSDMDSFQKFLFYIYKNRDEDKIGLTRKYESFLKRLQDISKLNRNKIAAYDFNGNLLGEFKSAPEMAKAMNVSVPTIHCAMSKRNGITKKFIIKKLT